MNPSRWAWALFATAAVIMPVFVLRAESNAAGRMSALAHARQLSSELRRLRDEYRQLAARQEPTEERQELEFNQAELERLRSRLTMLKKHAAPLGDGDATNERAAPQTVAAEDWIYAGRATPAAAIESVLWAASRGDVDHLADLLGFTDDVRGRAEAVFSRLPPSSQQEYGSPEKVVATLLAGSFPKAATAMTIVDGVPGELDAQISMRVDHSSGGPRTNEFYFHHAQNGWQLIVPASVMEGYEKTVLGDQQSPEPDSP
jgi:hypothetical protein